MENKPRNVLDTLNEQGEKIEDISQRLEGISIDNLYVLAKRTWDYGDYQTAQKYYNHISLLNPLDWEAPLYASLCNFNGYILVSQRCTFPKQIEKIIISTLHYLNDLNFDVDEKEKQIEKCLKIVEKELSYHKKLYLDNKETFDDCDSYYVFNLEECFVNIYKEVKKLNFKCVNKYCSLIVDNCFELIDLSKRISSNITKEKFSEMLSVSSKGCSIDVDKYFNSLIENSNCADNLSLDEIKDIKMKGTMYFVFGDKVFAKRNFKNNLMCGILLLILSIIGIFLSFVGKLYWLFIFVFTFIYGVLLLIKAITEKDKINCSSILCFNREINRYTSDKNVVRESKISLFNFITKWGTVLLYAGIYMIILSFIFVDLFVAITFSTLVVLNLCIFCYAGSKQKLYRYESGKYIYYYKEKYYIFNK